MDILVAGAFGYGNIGDDTYPLVYQKRFGKNHNIIVVNSDIKEIPKSFDILVMGGGGLLFDDGGGHVEYMARYMKEAIKRKVPYGFISVGLQCTKGKEGWNFGQVDKWIPWVKKADFASFRDKTSYEYFSDKTERTDFTWAPDLGYAFKLGPQKLLGHFTKDLKYLLVVPCFNIKQWSDESKEVAKEWQKENPTSPVFVMNMGGPTSNFRVDEAIKHLWFGKNAVPIYSSDITPHLALELISKADHLITGRYHGMVFARMHCVPYTLIDSTNTFKIANEDLSVGNAKSEHHLAVLKRELEKARTK